MYIELVTNNMEGVLLIGSFPEATLVHRYIWKRTDNVEVAGIEPPERGWLRIVPEIRATKADIVLGDLDGNWENIYVQPTTQIPFFRGIPHPMHGENWHQSNRNITFSTTEVGTKEFEDFFFLDDGKFTVKELGAFRRIYSSIGLPRRLVLNSKVVNYQIGHTNKEITVADSENVNKIVQPEIMVSRINAKHIALKPVSNNDDFPALNAWEEPTVIPYRTRVFGDWTKI